MDRTDLPNRNHNDQAKLEARGEGNKGSREKLEREELRSRMFGLFAKKDVYMLKELNKELQQTEVCAGRVCRLRVFFSLVCCFLCSSPAFARLQLEVTGRLLILTYLLHLSGTMRTPKPTCVHAYEVHNFTTFQRRRGKCVSDLLCSRSLAVDGP